MSTVTIIPSTSEHARVLGRSMREADAREITCLGLIAHRVLWRSYKVSVLRKTALVDGEVAAMWGTGGVLLGRVGHPWLLTGPAAEKVSPLTFVKIYRREAREMLALFPILENWVDASYHRAVKLLELSGFVLGEPKPFGPDRVPFRQYRMVR